MRRLVIGIGNPDRGDDAAGTAVAERVTGVATKTADSGAMDLYELWEPEDEVFVVDAMRSGRLPGTVHWFNVAEEELPLEAFSSTHSFGPATGIELARALGRLPQHLTVVGIEAGNLTVGASLSRAVAAAVEEVAKELSHA